MTLVSLAKLIRPQVTRVMALVTLSSCDEASRHVPSQDGAANPTNSTARGNTAASSAVGDGAARAPLGAQRPALIIGPTVVWLDSTVMADVARALGSGAIRGEEDPTAWLLEACYSVGVGADRVTVLLTGQGGGELDSPTLQRVMSVVNVTKAAVSRSGASRSGGTETARCTPIPVATSQIRWWNGLQLGMARPDVERLLGPHKEKADDEWIYEGDASQVPTSPGNPRSGQPAGASRSYPFTVWIRYERDATTRIEVRHFGSSGTF